MYLLFRSLRILLQWNRSSWLKITEFLRNQATVRATRNNKQTFRLPRISDDEISNTEYKITMHKILKQVKSETEKKWAKNKHFKWSIWKKERKKRKVNIRCSKDDLPLANGLDYSKRSISQKTIKGEGILLD